MFRKLLLSVVAVLFTSGLAFAQSGTLTGTVTDAETGDPIPGVNVFIPDLQKGSATDTEGNFTITNLEYDTYTVRASYIGYQAVEEEVVIDQQTVTLDIALEPGTEELEDVVVTAYGIERKAADLTYSAENVDVDDITTSGSDNFMGALTGKVAGLQVESKGGIGGSTDMTLRGVNSLSANNQALFVVDGVPYTNERFNTGSMQEGFEGYDFGNTAADINENDIKSISILKGPTAAALYGSRAANGAIIIETKKGSPADKNVQVTFNSTFGVSKLNKNTFPDYQEKYGAGYAASFYTEDNVFSDSPESITVARLNADGSLGPAFDEDKMVYQWDSFTEGHPNYGEPRPWVYPENEATEFFETGTNAENSLSINGSLSEDGYYTFDFSEQNQRGILPNSQLDKHSVGFKGGYNVTDKFMVTASIDYTRNEAVGRPRMGYSTEMSLFRQWWQTNVDVLKQKKSYFRDRTNDSWNLSDSRDEGLYWNNMYWDRYESYQSDDRDRYVGSAQLKYEVTDWLDLTGRVSLDHFNQLIELRTAKPDFGVSGYTRRNYVHSEFNYDLLANFNKQLSEDITIDGVLGMNIRRHYDSNISAETNGGLVNQRLYSLDNSVNGITFPSEAAERLGVNGFFANVNLNYKDFLAVNVTGRRDKSSSLPDGNNVYYYPSVSAGFTFSEFIDNNWLSFGKVRASYAEVGNTAPAYSLVNTFDRPANFNGSPMYSLPGTRNNPELKPERIKSMEAGLQLGFVNNRIFLDATYYKRNSVDLIQPTKVSTATGYVSKFINAGNLQNRGLEFTLSLQPVVSKNFSWTLDANWSKNISKVKKIAEDVDFFELASPQGGVTIGAVKGGPFGIIRGYDFIYKNGEPVVGEDGLYKKTNAANHKIGNMNPDWRGGVSNKLDYKNWSLNFLVDVRWGGDIFSLDQWYGQGTGLYKSTVGLNDLGNPIRDPAYSYDDDGNRTGLLPEEERGGLILPGVNEDGSENDIYKETHDNFGYQGNNPHARYVYDGSFVKLREVGITYRLPKSILSNQNILSGASLSLTGRNLWIIHKNLPDADPERSIGDASLTGYQGGNLPSTRNVTLNLQLKF